MVKTSTIKVIFTLAVTSNWDIQPIDINNALLNCELREVIMYMARAEGFEDPTKSTHVCKLNEALHGLKQASREV